MGVEPVNHAVDGLLGHFLRAEGHRNLRALVGVPQVGPPREHVQVLRNPFLAEPGPALGLHLGIDTLHALRVVVRLGL